MTSEQWQFDFKDWRDAFEMFYRKKAKDSAFCLVISTGDMVSGYWVERNATSDKESKVYRSVKAVKLLERRVKYAIKNQKSARLGRMIY